VSNRQVVNEIYQAFGQGDLPGVLARFHPDAEWRLAESHPYAPDGEAWIGPEAIKRHAGRR
jgi:ketosteroid isomerase-like protein